MHKYGTNSHVHPDLCTSPLEMIKNLLYSFTLKLYTSSTNHYFYIPPLFKPFQEPQLIVKTESIHYTLKSFSFLLLRMQCNIQSTQKAYLQSAFSTTIITQKLPMRKGGGRTRPTKDATTLRLRDAPEGVIIASSYHTRQYEKK